jgi:hypothetical protein
MTTWTFFGRILPERAPLSIALPEWAGEVPDFGLRYRITIQIAHGQFVVPVVVESGQVALHTLRNVVENDLRIATDLIGYLEGASFDIDMISATSDDGSTTIFGIKIPALDETRTKRGTIDNDLIKAVAEEITARFVLADFREAIRSPVGTGFFCYRAVEAMMQSMKTGGDQKDVPAWELLRTRLQVDRSAIDAIKKHADYPRHGKHQPISDADRAKVFRLTDEIVRRFLAYVRRGKIPLALSEFPLFSLATGPEKA